mmetsp:Transcript_4845/g.17906  ORF Transcript_4845/g.17906 Transcript_4845/m.17906 type:complete len:245 (-) Transcript_4845:1429-2163(-)
MRRETHPRRELLSSNNSAFARKHPTAEAPRLWKTRAPRGKARRIFRSPRVASLSRASSSSTPTPTLKSVSRLWRTRFGKPRVRHMKRCQGTHRTHRQSPGEESLRRRTPSARFRRRRRRLSIFSSHSIFESRSFPSHPVLGSIYPQSPRCFSSPCPSCPCLACPRCPHRRTLGPQWSRRTRNRHLCRRRVWDCFLFCVPFSVPTNPGSFRVLSPRLDPPGPRLPAASACLPPRRAWCRIRRPKP